MGGAIADLGEAAAIFWFDTPDWGDHINMGFSILGLDALFITPPTILDLAIERNDEMGLSAATSGNNVLVAGPAPRDPPPPQLPFQFPPSPSNNVRKFLPPPPGPKDYRPGESGFKDTRRGSEA